MCWHSRNSGGRTLHRSMMVLPWRATFGKPSRATLEAGFSELIVDRDGKLEAVVVGVGGFLGLGEHDVAIPYSQISWVYLPAAQSRASTAPITTGAESTVDRNPEGAHPSADKAVINMTKDQLKAAPAFKFSR